MGFSWLGSRVSSTSTSELPVPAQVACQVCVCSDACASISAQSALLTGLSVPCPDIEFIALINNLPGKARLWFDLLVHSGMAIVCAHNYTVNTGKI